jgi:hypothetical protein
MATYNWTTNANMIPEIIARETIEQTKSNMQLTKLCRQDFSSEIAGYGDTIKIPKSTKPTVQSKTPGTAISTRAGLSTSVVEVALEKHFVVPFTIEDTGRILSKPRIFQMAMQDAGIAMAEKIETYIFELITTHGASSSSYRVGTFGSAIDYDLIQSIKLAMDKAKIPQGYERYVIVGPEGENNLFDIAELSKAINAGNVNSESASITGKINKALGINFAMNQLEPTTTGTPTERSGIAFVSPAIAVINRALEKPISQNVSYYDYADPDTGLNIRVTMNYDSNNIGDNINIECLLGAKIIMPDWCWEVRH